MRRRVLVTFALTVIAVVAFPASAGAARDGSSRGDRRISVSGDVVVETGEVVNGPVVSFDGPVIVDGTVNDDVFVANGRVTIRGRVTGDVLVAHGNVLVTGRSGGDVIALDGRITVRAGARVSGDVVSRQQPNVAPGTVRGDVKKLNVGNLFTGFLIVFLIFLWVAVTVSVAILGLVFILLFPRGADATVDAGRRFWPSIGWGALVGIVGPILGVLVLVTIVGIPLGLGILSALTVLTPLGYVASCLVLGRLMVKGTSMGSRIGAFFAGFGILRAVALIPGLGFLAWFLACLYGLGALTRAAWRAGRARSSEEPPTPPPPAVEPSPATEAPTTEAPTTEAPTTEAPTTEAQPPSEATPPDDAVPVAWKP